MTSPMRFGIIGCGRIAQRHAEHISKVGQLVAVCDIIEEKANELGKKYGAKSYKDVDELLSELITENYLNEERFAILFAGGKFRIKQWGRIKIKYALKQKQVSEYCIKKALADINETDYNRTLQKLFEQKLKTLKAEKNIFIKKRKLQDHLMQKGFEAGLIQQLTAKI